jgi:hypothetical protein
MGNGDRALQALAVRVRPPKKPGGPPRYTYYKGALRREAERLPETREGGAA